MTDTTQLIDRAFGIFEPAEVFWETDSGGFVDPFRPQIEPEPWSTIEQVVQSSCEHFASVRRVFLETDVLVFTLGLTEAFVFAQDGAVYPMAPGVAGGSYSPDRYRFTNFTVSEVVKDLNLFVSKARAINPKIRIILTVSPVPLIATFEPRHVLVSTTISKTTLRVAAHEISEKFDYVDYFPSYVIISGSAIGANYFEDDLRQVRQVGVDHVMRIFEKHMVQQSDPTSRPIPELHSQDSQHSIVCDEETVIATLRASGISAP